MTSGWRPPRTVSIPDYPRRVRLLRPVVAPFLILGVLLIGGVAELDEQGAALADARTAGVSARLGLPVVWRAEVVQSSYDRPGDLEPTRLLPASGLNAATAAELVEQALTEYPPGYARRFLDRVYIVSGIMEGQRRAGGMVYGRAIWIKAGDMSVAQNRRYTRMVVFHESATAILDQATLDRAAFEKTWSSVNPPGFQYWAQLHPDGDEGAAALGRDMQSTPTLFAAGFLNDYGRTSVRADFDTYMDAMFTQAPALRGWMAANPRVRQKVTLVQNLLIPTDPRFRGVFARLGLPSAE